MKSAKYDKRLNKMLCCATQTKVRRDGAALAFLDVTVMSSAHFCAAAGGWVLQPLGALCRAAEAEKRRRWAQPSGN